MITFRNYLLTESKASLLKKDKSKVYVKKKEEIGKFMVWIVDGDFIRSNIEEEFTNFACHYQFSFIPKNEIWLDKQSSADESNFYIDRLLYQIRLIEGGMPYDKSYDLAERKEADERHCSKGAVKGKGEEHIVKDIKKKLWKTISSVKVYIVSGEEVRDKCYMAFTEGGNSQVYKFIPKNEVWIDDEVAPKERDFVLLHELFERKQMKEHGLKYDQAHKKASAIEWKYRQNPKGLEK
jgi:hypothetical protein